MPAIIKRERKEEGGKEGGRKRRGERKGRKEGKEEKGEGPHRALRGAAAAVKRTPAWVYAGA